MTLESQIDDLRQPESLPMRQNADLGEKRELILGSQKDDLQ